MTPIVLLALAVLTAAATRVISLVLHEAGHWGAAWLAGVPVNEVRIGEGRIVGRFRLGPTAVRLGLRPRSGLVLFGAAPSRAALLAILAAGPLAEFAFGAGLVLALFAGMLDRDLAPLVFLALALIGLSLVRNLVPRQISVAGEAVPNDGLRLLALLRAPVRRERGGASPAGS